MSATPSPTKPKVEGSGVAPAWKNPPLLNVTVALGKITRPILFGPVAEKVTAFAVLPSRMPDSPSWTN
jgi:hypothetical protein